MVFTTQLTKKKITDSLFVDWLYTKKLWESETAFLLKSGKISKSWEAELSAFLGVK